MIDIQTDVPTDVLTDVLTHVATDILTYIPTDTLTNIQTNIKTNTHETSTNINKRVKNEEFRVCDRPMMSKSNVFQVYMDQ